MSFIRKKYVRSALRLRPAWIFHTISCEISGLHVKKLNEYRNPAFIIVYVTFNPMNIRVNEKRVALASAGGFI